MNKITDSFWLRNQVAIPCVGFGTWKSPDGEVAYNAVKKALQVGYRHIDTAAIYGNERSVGQAIKDSGIPRSEIFVTTKLWNDSHSYDLAYKGLEQSLQRLQLDYVDLYLIHWPNPSAFRDHWAKANAEAWRAMEEMYQSGKIRAIGVSNFRIHHLQALYQTAQIKPMVNQIRVCPGELPTELIEFCRQDQMLIEAYSPLGTGAIFEVPEMVALAAKHQTTVAQIALKWSIQKGFLPLPKSVTASRIEENTKFLEIQLSDQDVAKIDQLDGVCGYADDPDTSVW